MMDREQKAVDVWVDIMSRIRPERDIDREIGRSKEQYGRERPSRFSLNNDQKRLFSDLKQFRVMRPADIIEHRYGGNEHRYHRDLTPMRQLALIGMGKARRLDDSSTVIYRRDMKPKFKDAMHDADVYALYERYRRDIITAHCSIASVRTEAQLQSEFWVRIGKPVNQANLAIRKAAAKELNLPVINDKVMFPDVRLEVDIPDGRKWKRETVDLEYTTGSGSYRGSAIDTKRAAGFNVHGPESGLGGTPFGVRQDFSR